MALPGADEEALELEPGHLSVRYVGSVFLEFIRCIFENQIPLQPAQ